MKLTLVFFGSINGGPKILNLSTTKKRKQAAEKAQVSLSYIKKLLKIQQFSKISNWKVGKNSDITWPIYKLDAQKLLEKLLSNQNDNKVKVKKQQTIKLKHFWNRCKQIVDQIGQKDKLLWSVLHFFYCVQLSNEHTLKLSKNTYNKYFRILVNQDLKEYQSLICYLSHMFKRLRGKKEYIRKMKELRQKPINERPIEATLPTEPGHFEIDTLRCRKQKCSYAAMIIDRKTKNSFMWPIKSLEAKEMNRFLEKAIKWFKYPIKTITFDNGPENALLHKVSKEIQCYVCNPYSPQEKPFVENRIKLYRSILETKKPLQQLTSEEVNDINEFANLKAQMLNLKRNFSKKKFTYMNKNFSTMPLNKKKILGVNWIKIS